MLATTSTPFRPALTMRRAARPYASMMSHTMAFGIGAAML